jgi:hypothetical protein
MRINWEKLRATRGGPCSIADVDGIGRLLVKRVHPGSREFVGMINSVSVAYADTEQGCMAETAKVVIDRNKKLG